MKKLIILVSVFYFMISCEKSSTRTDNAYTAVITGYDLNCSTCIIGFPYDISEVNEYLGPSPENTFQAINLNKDEFSIGQILRVNIRKAGENELLACITLYPSYNFKNLVVTDFEKSDNLVLDDTVEVSYHRCLFNADNQIYLCLDSVLNDSRCPKDVECIWAGDAEVRFKFAKSGESPVFINLNLRPVNWVITGGYKFTLIDLHPPASFQHPISQRDYIAVVRVEKNSN